MTGTGYVFVACYEKDSNDLDLTEEQVLIGIGLEGQAVGWDFDLAQINIEENSYEFELVVEEL